MSTDKFVHSAMRTSCAALCQAIGWNATQSTALDVLSDVLQRYFMEIAKRTHSYAEHSGRSEPNVDDATLVFEDMHISIPELEEYVQNFDPVHFPVSVPAFPIERESHLNFLRPGSQEVLTRPVHVHEYMPPMIIEEEPKVKKDRLEIEVHTPAPSTSTDKADGEAEVEKPVALVNGRVNGVDGDSKGVDSDEDSDNSLLTSNLISPHSPKTPKSKRLESPGENPALKRVRMMLEEEGHPLREITSVMMTTSGFLTSSREGRLPEARAPPNRDFFEPIISPVPEKKKKIPTMKKIVEGVKKIDKEKENQSDKDKGESGFNLFERPDKILTTPSSSTSDKNVDKVSTTSEKVKESKESKAEKKKEKSEKRAEKKSKEEKSDKQKLKIFKKKSKEAAKEIPVKVKPVRQEETGLDNIESDEDFGTQSSSQSRETSPDKKSRKKEKLLANSKLNEKKPKKKSLVGNTPSPKIKTPKKVEPIRIFDNPDKIVHLPVLIGAQKKKRGRPKKAVSPFNILAGLHALEPPPPPSIKPVKFSRKQLMAQEDIDMKPFVPEISINVNVKPPPPPDFGQLHRLPLQPGLIPAFVPQPQSLKMPNPLPPSISITPATPTITPSSPAFKEGRNSGQFGSLPSNVCSSVTITRIDMSNSQKLPTPFDSQSTPGIGSPNLSSKSTSSTTTTVPIQSDSGITITPIVMEKQSVQIEKPERTMNSGLAKLEQNMKSKEQKRKDREKRKEQRKEKKKEKKEKSKEKMKKVDKSSQKEKDKSVKKEKKDKSEKKRKKEKDISTVSVEATVPKLTLKLQHSSTTTPIDSPNPPPSYHGDTIDHPVPKKITIKPIEEIKQRTPSPELARFSPLFTRPSKKVPLPKKSPPAVIAKTPKQEIVAFPPVSSSSSASSNSNLKRGRGRPPKSTKSSSKSSTQAGLVTETVGSYIDEEGNKVWICPACGRQDDGSPMIGCEKCDDWYHFTCVGIVEAPDASESWFCKKCVVKEKSQNFEHRKKNRL